MSELAERFETHDPGEKLVAEKIRCDACPVMCYIADGRTGACDRYGNVAGRIVRMDPLTILDHAAETGAAILPFVAEGEAWDGELLNTGRRFVTAIGAGTTYPDYKPAPFIVSQEVEGVDLVTVVTEGIFSYCGVKVKIDTDRHIGPETAVVRSQGEAIGHVTTGEYGSQMLSLGGVHHLTGGSKAEGRATCDALLALCNRKPVELTIDGGATIIVEAGKPPVIDGKTEHRMRVGCGSATIGMFATQWRGLVDEVVVVDDHITGVVSEHQAGKVLGWQDTGIKIIGRRSTPGRYFKVSEPGLGWGGTSISDPLSILGEWNAKKGARPGLSMLMVSTTGEQFGYYELDDELKPVEKPFPERLQKSVNLIEDNCEPALCTVLFIGGAGGSLRAGVTENPVNLTRSVQGLTTYVTVGGAPVYVWPGGGITLMVDVTRVPEGAFGYVPTPALVAPIEFTLRRDDYVRLGGYEAEIRSLDDIVAKGGEYLNPRRGSAGAAADNPWPPLAQLRRAGSNGGRMMDGPQAHWLQDGKRLHLNHGPIDLIIEVFGEADECRAAYAQAVARFQTILIELVEELPELRLPAFFLAPRAFAGPTARRMEAAVMPLAECFITPMAAVAGSVADEMLAALLAGRKLDRAYVNNGGDSALHIDKGRSVKLAIAGAGHDIADRITIRAEDGVGGVATSGWRGRSFSLGIADAVTVLARTGAEADAAATIIANAVDLPGNPAIRRIPAHELSPDSDLGALLVTQSVGPLALGDVVRALDNGLAVAEDFRRRGLIAASALFLGGEARISGSVALAAPNKHEPEEIAHA